MPSPNDPNGTADEALVAPESTKEAKTLSGGHEVTDGEAAGADGDTGGSGPRDGEK
jgi:hypothetical protein